MAATIKITGYAPNGTDTRTSVSTTIIEPASVVGTPDDETSHFLIGVQLNDVMVTFDGSDPSATNGHRYASGYQEFWTKQMAFKARWIRQSADAAVQATPFCFV